MQIMQNPTVTIAEETPDQPEIRALIEASNRYMEALYPAESNHLLDIASLAGSEVRFLVARLGGRAVGCGALVRSGDGWAEIKRMFVDPAARGHRIGRHILDRLETIARAEDIQALRLETGIHQPEAIGLYRAVGFVEIAPFGSYLPDPLSLFMEKTLADAG